MRPRVGMKDDLGVVSRNSHITWKEPSHVGFGKSEANSTSVPFPKLTWNPERALYRVYTGYIRDTSRGRLFKKLGVCTLVNGLGAQQRPLLQGHMLLLGLIWDSNIPTP